MTEATYTDGDRDQTDVDAATELAAERIAAAVDCAVQARNWPACDGDRIVVSWDHDSVGDVNSYSKASIIDAVYESPAAVALADARDGDEALVFEVRDR